MKHLIPLILCAAPAFADAPVATDIAAQVAGDAWRFDVTITHPDTGWDHYADGWQIETADGIVLGTRVLAHPHVSEQPFTRSLAGVAVPEGTTVVHIRTRCIADGWSADTVAFTLP